MTDQEIRSVVLQTVNEIRRDPSILNLNKTVSFNFCVTKMKIPRKKLEKALLTSAIDAKLIQGEGRNTWEINRRSVEKYFNISK